MVPNYVLLCIDSYTIATDRKVKNQMLVTRVASRTQKTASGAATNRHQPAMTAAPLDLLCATTAPSHPLRRFDVVSKGNIMPIVHRVIHMDDDGGHLDR